MLDVMRVHKTRVVTTGERTAFVAGNQGAFDGCWHGSGLATDVQGFSVLIFADNDRMTITTQSSDVLRVCSALPDRYPLAIDTIASACRVEEYFAAVPID